MPGDLAATVAEYNRHAREGRDPEFGRGGTAFNRKQGDPAYPGPNPCVAPIERGPYYAVQVEPGILIEALSEAGCEVRASATVLRVIPGLKPATGEDWRTEYLDSIISVAVVDGIGGAIDHIARYSSNHTEAVVAEDPEVVERFFNEIDSAILLHNASTQFADGGEFGFGAEIGIATDKLHARGPVGAEQLTTFKYVVRGTGQTRP